MGTLRYEKEYAEQMEKVRLSREIERKRDVLKLEEAELNARMVALQRDLEVRRAELARLELEQTNGEARWQTNLDKLVKMRSGDISDDDLDRDPEPDKGR